jgi:lambda repressor-like predicted transcriptional regulator
LDTAARVLELMMEGTSVRAISHLTGLDISTILDLMVTAGNKCQRLLDALIRNVRPNLVQADELHSFAATRNGCVPTLRRNGGGVDLAGA